MSLLSGLNIRYLGTNVINNYYMGEVSSHFLQLKENCFKILFIGRPSYKEGALMLLRSFKKINSHYPKSELHLIGMSEDYFENNDICKNVFFTGTLKKKMIMNVSCTMNC